MKIQAWLEQAREELGKIESLKKKNSIEAETELTLEYLLKLKTGKKWKRSDWMMDTAFALDEGDLGRGHEILNWRKQGLPLQHLLGEQEFFGRSFQVSPDVLIPRPETETLVEAALEKLQSRDLRGLEIGVGSGAISITLLSEKTDLKMVATDLSLEVLRVAKHNSEGHRVHPDSIEWIRVEDPLTVFPSGLGKFDFIISNPPYLLTSDPIEEEVKQYEPATALYSPQADPIYFYRKIAEEGRAHLNPHGWVALEIPHQRSEAIAQVFKKEGWKSIGVIPDLTGRDRVLMVEL